MNNTVRGQAAALSQGELMLKLQEIGLTIDDLQIYLDVHAYDTFAIERYNIAVADYKRVLANYEELYGPLTKLEANSSEANFLWALQDFPWDYQF